MTIKIIINVCLPSQQTVFNPFSLSSFLDNMIQKKNLHTHSGYLIWEDLLLIKKFHMHKVTAATSLPECAQNCALFMNRSTVNSGYCTELTGWKHEAGWTLESVFWWQISQQLCLHEHLHRAEAPGSSAHHTPKKQNPITDSSTKTHPITGWQVEMAAFMGNQNKFLQHHFSSAGICSRQQNPSYQLRMQPSSCLLHLAQEKAAKEQEQHQDLFEHLDTISSKLGRVCSYTM